MLKGKTTIELTDINTGEVAVFEDTNLITNAMSDLCQRTFKRGNTIHHTYSFYSDPISFNQLFGGILLFDTALEENPNKYFPPTTANMVGHGSNITYTGTDLSLGSFNDVLYESSEKMRKFVWDFTAEQANGTIASVCLTTQPGGIIGHGTTTPCEVSSTPQRILSGYTRSCFETYYDTSRAYFIPIYLSFENDFVLYMATNSIKAGKLQFVKIPLHSHKEDIFINMPSISSSSGTSYDYAGHNYTEFNTTVVDLTSVVNTTGYVGCGQDGKYLYIAKNATTNDMWAVNSEITLVKINLDDLTYETFKVINTTGEGIRMFDYSDYYSFSIGYMFGVCDGYMFVKSNATEPKFYAINLSDNTIVHTIKTPDGNDLIGASSSCSSCFGMTVNNHITFSKTKENMYSRQRATWEPIQIVNTNDFIAKTLNCPYWGIGSRDATVSNNTNNSDRAFPTDNPLYFGWCMLNSFSSSKTNGNFYVGSVPNVLMTINNLETPVTKTSSQTMRITYTLTKEE